VGFPGGRGGDGGGESKVFGAGDSTRSLANKSIWAADDRKRKGGGGAA